MEAAVEAIGNGPGQHIMDGFQAVVNAMQEEQALLLTLPNTDAQRRVNQTKPS